MRQSPLCVIRRWPAHRIDMHHPAIAQSGKRLVDSKRNHFPLLGSAAGIVATFVERLSRHAALRMRHHHLALRLGETGNYPLAWIIYDQPQYSLISKGATICAFRLPAIDSLLRSAMFKRILKSGEKYFLAFLLVLAATVARLALNPILNENAPLLIFTLPVAAAALHGGFGPAIFATFLGGTVGAYLFVNGIGFDEFTLAEQVGVALFFGIGSILSYLGGKLMQARNQAQESAEQLKAADKRKDEFISMLGHELRNPLAGISTASELLQYVRLDGQRHAQASDVIRRQIGHMTRLLDDLLDMARISRGLVHLSKVPLDLAEVANEAAAQCQAVVDQHRHQLTLKLLGGPAWIEGDRTRLVQVVSNLIINAAKYSPPGSHITVGLECDDRQAVLAVEDDGNGLSPELLPHVFEPFVQAERKIDRSQGGLGLGLSIVRNIVQLHGGTVAAHSEGVGKGSRFCLTLPRLSVDTQAPAVSRSEGLPARGLRLLVVDDNQDAAQSLEFLLTALGHTVVTEYGSKGALERAKTQVFDAMILDIGMPDMDGYELAQRIGTIAPNAQAVLIALTGYGKEEDVKKAREAGFAVHFTKPATLAQITDVLAVIKANPGRCKGSKADM